MRFRTIPAAGVFAPGAVQKDEEAAAGALARLERRKRRRRDPQEGPREGPERLEKRRGGRIRRLGHREGGKKRGRTLGTSKMTSLEREYGVKNMVSEGKPEKSAQKNVEVRVYGSPKRLLPDGDVALVEFVQGETVNALLNRLKIADEDVWMVTVNEVAVGEDYVLSPGDKVGIMSPVSGG